MKKSIFSFILIAILSFVGFTAITFAQTSQNTVSFLSISLSPINPEPNSNVTATVSYSQGNTDTTNITWALNGQTKISGTGKKSFTFKTGNIGETSTVQVFLDTDSYGTINKEISISPNTLEILWEADTYTPPFYKGKALPTSQSTVRVIALPRFVYQNTPIDANSVVYKWKKGYFTNQASSGFGKNAFVYKTGYTFTSDDITLTATTQDQSISITKKIPVYVYEPKIVFFENKPLQGVRYENAIIDLFNYTESEVTVHAIPFFFSFADINNNNAAFTWRLDGKTLETNPDNRSEFTLRKPEKGSGRYQLKLGVDNKGYDLQTASKSISLVYNNQ
ncbi:MAG: hypothetical protein NT098_00170 [Candidatus Parcubacteria bacterium]|nr:hypothetical protein [Candidatus Parcubacteria bacterium]